LASRTEIAETAAGPVNLGGKGLVFTVLRENGASHGSLIQAMARLAAQENLAGWIVSDRESGLTARAVGVSEKK